MKSSFMRFTASMQYADLKNNVAEKHNLLSIKEFIYRSLRYRHVALLGDARIHQSSRNVRVESMDGIARVVVT